MLGNVLFALFLAALGLGFVAMAAVFLLYLRLGTQAIWKAFAGHREGGALEDSSLPPTALGSR